MKLAIAFVVIVQFALAQGPSPAARPSDPPPAARPNWQLKGDKRAALMFLDSDCGLCVNPKWGVQTKNFK